MAEKTKEETANQSKSPTDSDTPDDTKVSPRFKTSVEERQYHTRISYSNPHSNPTVEQGPPRCKVRVKKPSTNKTKDNCS